MKANINTKEYWDQRFSSGDWENRSGRMQTINFVKGQLPFFRIPQDFRGTIVDFGCGLGDAMDIYKKSFPNADLVGIDISQSAIDKCREKFNSIARFIQGDYKAVPSCDIIIASNVLEHISSDIEIVNTFINKCNELYIIVPYKEWPLCSEHVNTYDEAYYSSIGNYRWVIFTCVGWSQIRFKLWYNVYFKNIFRKLLRRPIDCQKKQIMFHIRRNIDNNNIMKVK
jgi:SAM-dependent methyltransferase